MPVSLLNGSRLITVRDDKLGIYDGDPDTTYTVRQLLPSETKVITKRHTVSRANGDRVDQVALMEDLIDAAIVDWSGVLADGEPAPCTRENKLLLDGPRRMALLNVAGLNQVDAIAARDHSFRPPA